MYKTFVLHSSLLKSRWYVCVRNRQKIKSLFTENQILFDNCGHHSSFIIFHCMEVIQLIQSARNISFHVPWKKVSHTRSSYTWRRVNFIIIRVNKWWQKCHFWVNCSFKVYWKQCFFFVRKQPYRYDISKAHPSQYLIWSHIRDKQCLCSQIQRWHLWPFWMCACLYKHVYS